MHVSEFNYWTLYSLNKFAFPKNRHFVKRQNAGRKFSIAPILSATSIKNRLQNSSERKKKLTEAMKLELVDATHRDGMASIRLYKRVHSDVVRGRDTGRFLSDEAILKADFTH